MDLEFGGACFALTVGHTPSGEIAELFVSGPKIGSELQRILDAAAVTISLRLQHGGKPAALCRSMSRLDGSLAPASVIGGLADLLAREAGDAG